MDLDDEMRDWLLACFDSEAYQDEIMELSHNGLVRAIERYYDGGMATFMKCIGWNMVTA